MKPQGTPEDSATTQKACQALNLSFGGTKHLQEWPTARPSPTWVGQTRLSGRERATQLLFFCLIISKERVLIKFIFNPPWWHSPQGSARCTCVQGVQGGRMTASFEAHHFPQWKSKDALSGPRYMGHLVKFSSKLEMLEVGEDLGYCPGCWVYQVQLLKNLKSEFSIQSSFTTLVWTVRAWNVDMHLLQSCPSFSYSYSIFVLNSYLFS